jgi:hypothetical protein
MNLHDFVRFCESLTAKGYTVRAAEYWGYAFGSWVIEFSSDGARPHRLAWDGRDRWLALQTERPERERQPPIAPEVLRQMSYEDGTMAQLRRKEDAWRDAWIGRDVAEQSLDRALEHLAPA